MKVIEVISKVKEMPIGTIIVCKKIKAKYELVKDNTGKNKHFRRIKEGKSIPRFSGLIYSDLDFEIVKYCGCCGGELTEKDYSDFMCWECKYGFPDFRILEDNTEEIEEISKITKEEFERLDKRTLLELIVKNQNKIIDKLNKPIDTSKETNCMTD
jgi:hypothetical protein